MFLLLTLNKLIVAGMYGIAHSEISQKSEVDFFGGKPVNGLKLPTVFTRELRLGIF